MRKGIEIEVSAADRARLEAIVADRNSPQKHVWRARIILATADGCGTAAVMRRAGVSKPCVWRWQERFMTEGVDGLRHDKTRPSRIAPLPRAAVEGVVTRTLEEAPPAGVTHWTAPAMAAASGLSVSSVQRIWRAHGLRPHQVRSFKLSSDPNFAAKVEDIVGLYVDPPAHAVVLSIDEKSQIQALDRTQPGLPIKPGRCGTMTHDYKRNGTTTLFASFNVLDGTVLGRCMQRHRHQEFIRFLSRRGRRAGGQGDPRHPRQLRRPQAPQGAALADPAPALDLPLHPHLVLLAERGRDPVRQARQAPAQTRRVPLGGRPATSHQRLRRGAQP
jgi:transposase